VLDELERCHITSGVKNQGTWNECVDSIMRTIGSMPSVQPEPFINKPCISEGVCREDKMKVLEKIRTEIDAEYTKYLNKINLERAYALEKALAIIDRHIAESEDKDET
jgi:hypothetical protein